MLQFVPKTQKSLQNLLLLRAFQQVLKSFLQA